MDHSNGTPVPVLGKVCWSKNKGLKLKFLFACVFQHVQHHAPLACVTVALVAIPTVLVAALDLTLLTALPARM